MTYIVDKRVVSGEVVSATTVGQLAMGVNTDGVAAFNRLIGADGKSMKISSQEMEGILMDILGQLRVMSVYLSYGADFNVSTSDVEDL